MSPVPFENSPADAEVPATPPGTSQNATDATLSEAWVTIRARKKLIIAVAALGAIYGFYQGATQPRLYTASGTIQIRSGSSNEYRIGSSSLGGDSRLPTEVAIL